MTDHYRPFAPRTAMEWKLLHPQATMAMLGLIPEFLNSWDERPAKEQLHFAYGHGRGWVPFLGFRFDPEKLTLTYPGDPPQEALAETMLREERIIVFNSAWVMILQKDGSHEISRMD